MGAVSAGVWWMNADCQAPKIRRPIPIVRFTRDYSVGRGLVDEVFAELIGQHVNNVATAFFEGGGGFSLGPANRVFG